MCSLMLYENDRLIDRKKHNHFQEYLFTNIGDGLSVHIVAVAFNTLNSY